MEAPVDYVSGLGQLPDPLRTMQQQMAFRSGLNAQNVETQFKQAQIGAATQKLQRQGQFQSAMQAYLANPSAQGLASLLGQFPEYSEESKAAFGALDGERQKSELSTIGSIAALASKGDYGQAATMLQSRIDADKAAGHVDPTDQLVLEKLQSGDPVQQKQGLGLLTYSLGVAVGPEHAKSFLEVNGFSQEPNIKSEGGVLYNGNTGGIIGQVPGSDVKVVPGVGVTRVGIDGVPILGPDSGREPQSPYYPQTNGPPAQATGGFDAAVDHVLSNEGGYNPSDMNGAPVNFGINQGANPGVDVKSLTRDQARQIYLDKYWKPSGAESLPANMQAPYFDVYIRNPKVAKSALAQSKGDPAKFADITSSYFEKLAKTPKGKKYANAWADRDAKNRAIATGAGVEATAQAGGRTFYKIGGKWFDNPEGK